MTFVQRGLLLAAALLLGMLPLSGSALLGGGGDTGVWILPRSAFVGNAPAGSGGQATSNLVGGTPRAQLVRSLGNPVSMRVTGTISLPPAAVLVDPVSGLPLPLDVAGNVVTLTPRVAGLVGASATKSMTGTIVDVRGRGYSIVVSVDSARQTVSVQVW